MFKRMSRAPTGGAVITSAIDFLRPEINRPDLFTERSNARSASSRWHSQRRASKNKIGATNPGVGLSRL